MAGMKPRPILVVGDESNATQLVSELRRLGCLAVQVDACGSALEMIETVDFGLVIVNVEQAREWVTCRRLAIASGCPVVVATRFLAADKRYRNRAFRAGAAAYLCRPFSRSRLREMLARVNAGERSVELVEGAPYSDF